MAGLRRRVWWILPALSIVLVIFGVSDVLIGITSDTGIPVAIIGLTPDELQAVSAEGYRLADFMVRTQGLVIAAFGLLLTIVLLVPTAGASAGPGLPRSSFRRGRSACPCSRSSSVSPPVHRRPRR